MSVDVLFCPKSPKSKSRSFAPLESSEVYTLDTYIVSVNVNRNLKVRVVLLAIIRSFSFI